jgi:hypothetical protein
MMINSRPINDSVKHLLSFFILLTFFISCQEKDQPSRFPLAVEQNIDDILLTEAVNNFRKVDGALSLIVCLNGEIVAEEYTYY